MQKESQVHDEGRAYDMDGKSSGRGSGWGWVYRSCLLAAEAGRMDEKFECHGIIGRCIIFHQLPKLDFFGGVIAASVAFSS